MVTLLEGVLAVYSQGMSSNVRGKHRPVVVDKTLVTNAVNKTSRKTTIMHYAYQTTVTTRKYLTGVFAGSHNRLYAHKYHVLQF